MSAQRSNYPAYIATWNDPSSPEPARFVRCNACYGTGMDRHGNGDCLDCGGFGDIEVLD